MGWTDHVPLTEEDKFFEQLKELPIRDHTVVVASMTLITAFKDADKIEQSFFKDLCFALGKMIKHATALDTLQFLVKNLEEAPAATTIADVILLLNMMSHHAHGAADTAAKDTMKLVALLPSEAHKDNA